jgi:hypothetical protein
MEASGQLHTPGRFIPRERAPGIRGEEPLPGLEPPIIQPVAQRYTTVLLLINNPRQTGQRYFKARNKL